MVQRRRPRGRRRRSRKSTDLANSAEHDDDVAETAGGREESRVAGIKSSPNIGVPDRRGRELINCRSVGQGGEDGERREKEDREGGIGKAMVEERVNRAAEC